MTQDVRLSNCCANGYVVLSQIICKVLVCMEWIDSHRHIDEGATVGSSRMDCLVCFFRMNWHCVGLLSMVFTTYLIGFMLRTTNQERKSALKNPRQCILQVCGNTLQVVETFKRLSDGNWNKEIDTRIGKANAVLRRQLSKTAKLSDFKSVFVPILTCGHES